NRDGNEQSRQQHQPQTDSVNANVITRVDRIYPGNILHKLKTVRRVSATAQKQERERKRQDRKGERNPAIMRLAFVRREVVPYGRDCAYGRKKNQNCEQVSLHTLLVNKDSESKVTDDCERA